MKKNDIKIVNNTWYAAPCNDKRIWYGFYEAKEAGKYIHGKNSTKIEVEFVETIDTNADHKEGFFFGVLKLEDCTIGYIWPSLIQTKICSPGAFRSEIKSGTHVFIRVKVKDKS